MKRFKAVAMLLVLVGMASAVLADTIAYVVPAGTVGNQVGVGPLGLDFDVNSDIIITQFGVFDDGSDGIQLPLQARLYERDDLMGCARALLAILDFTPDDPGTLIDGSVFKPLDNPITLPAGFNGSIVASGFGASERNANSFGNANPPWTTDDGGGLISFVGGGRFGSPNALEAYPLVIDGGPVNRYAAGTFIFKSAAD